MHGSSADAPGPRPRGHAAAQYIPREHVRTYERYRQLADLLDQAFRIPGTRIRFGLDAIIGLVPGAGDLAGAALAGYGLLLARSLGAPASVLVRMIGNIGLDALGGAVPLAGDAFDIAFKAHVRNRELLDRWLAEPRRVERMSRLALIGIPLAAVAAVALTIALGIAAIRALAGALGG